MEAIVVVANARLVAVDLHRLDQEAELRDLDRQWRHRRLRREPADGAHYVTDREALRPGRREAERVRDVVDHAKVPAHVVVIELGTHNRVAESRGEVITRHEAWYVQVEIVVADTAAQVQPLADVGLDPTSPFSGFDNSLAGSNEGCERYGLTPQGRVALREAEALGMVVDLAHLSQAGIRETLDLLEAPFTVSHTGIRAQCEPPCRQSRNLSDQEIEMIRHRACGYDAHHGSVGPVRVRLLARCPL